MTWGGSQASNSSSIFLRRLTGLRLSFNCRKYHYQIKMHCACIWIPEEDHKHPNRHPVGGSLLTVKHITKSKGTVLWRDEYLRRIRARCAFIHLTGCAARVYNSGRYFHTFFCQSHNVIVRVGSVGLVCQMGSQLLELLVSQSSRCFTSLNKRRKQCAGVLCISN
jgi:hypothetical protein